MEKKVKGISPTAMQKLMLHDWPGNVRELENIIEFALAMTNSDTITDNLILQVKDGQEELPTLQEARAKFEKKYIRNLLKITSGNVSKAAELAGKYRADLYNLMKKYDISPQDFKR
jgi:two-component system response regulator GlrR